MADRYFTPEQATAALEQVRPLAERMVAARRALAELLDRHSELAARIAGNGDPGAGKALAELQAEVEQQAQAVAACVEAIAALGAQVKDVETGLVDFPARRGEATVMLCWQLGEEEIGHWHGEDEGFAGRRPLPL